MQNLIKIQQELNNITLKQVVKIMPGMPTSDGAGVKLTRALGQGGLKHLDPFLMLDEIRSDVADDYIAGFPPHPHKGFETLTYMVQGSMEHNDSTGGHGLISSGGVQYMTAGKGIIHSETPKQDSGLMFGFQLWINLAAKDKLQEPKYVDISPDQIETITGTDSIIKVISGQLNSGNKDLKSSPGPVERNDIDMQMYDVVLKASDSPKSNQGEDQTTFLNLNFDKKSQGFVYVYQGELELNGQIIKEKHIAALKPSEDNVEAVNTKSKDESILISKRDSQAEVGFLVLMGNPINEPIVQYGPFVMNTMKEIDAALKDYQSGNFV